MLGPSSCRVHDTLWPGALALPGRGWGGLTKFFYNYIVVHMRTILRSLLVVALGLPTALGAQRLTLADALRRAEADGYGNRTARAQATAADATALAALQGALPTVRAEAGWVRT